MFSAGYTIKPSVPSNPQPSFADRFMENLQPKPAGAFEAAPAPQVKAPLRPTPTRAPTTIAPAAGAMQLILFAYTLPLALAKAHPEWVEQSRVAHQDPQWQVHHAYAYGWEASLRNMREVREAAEKTNADRHQAELDAAWQRMREMIEAFANQQRFNEDPFEYFMRLQSQALQTAMAAKSLEAASGAVKMSAGDTTPIGSTAHGANEEDDLRAQIAAILQQVPFLQFFNPADEVLPPYFPYGTENIPRVVSGELSYPRLETLYYYLCAMMSVRDAQVIDNGAGAMADLALSLARIGADVLVKDPSDVTRRVAKQVAKLPAELSGRIVYSQDINASTPADIVFWSDPDNQLVVPARMTVGEYLGRDVKPGGFLVIQTDHNFEGDQRSFYLQLGLDPNEWQSLYNDRIGPNLGNYENLLLPTIQGEHPIVRVQIYRRLAAPAIAATPVTAEADARYQQGLVRLVDALGIDSSDVKSYLKAIMASQEYAFKEVLHQVLTRLAFEVNNGPLEAWQIEVVKKMTTGFHDTDLLDGTVDVALLREYMTEVFHTQELCVQAHRPFDFYFPNDWHFLVGQHPTLNGILRQEIQNMQGFFRMFGDKAALLYSREGEFRAVLRDANQNALSYDMVISRGYHEQRNGFQIALYDKNSKIIESRYGGNTRTRCLAKVGVVFGEEGVLRIVNSQGLTQQQLGELTAQQRMAYLNEDLKKTSVVDLLLATLIVFAREKGVTRLEGIRDEAQLAKQQQFETSGREKGNNQFYNLLFRRFGFQPPENTESDYWSLDLVHLPIRRRKQPQGSVSDARAVTKDSENTLAEYVRQILVRETHSRSDVWDRTRPEPVAQPVTVFWKMFYRALHAARLRPGVNAESAALPLEDRDYLFPK